MGVEVELVRRKGRLGATFCERVASEAAGQWTQPFCNSPSRRAILTKSFSYAPNDASIIFRTKMLLMRQRLRRLRIFGNLGRRKVRRSTLAIGPHAQFNPERFPRRHARLFSRLLARLTIKSCTALPSFLPSYLHLMLAPCRAVLNRSCVAASLNRLRTLVPT